MRGVEEKKLNSGDFEVPCKKTSELNYDTIKLKAETEVYLHGFHCGLDSLDQYAHLYAYPDLSRGSGVTYIVIDKDLGLTIGYYTLSASSISFNDGGTLYPAVNVDNFAISEEYQDTLIDGANELVSTNILNGMIGEIYRLSREELGIQFVTLYSVDTAVVFYRDCGGFAPIGEVVQDGGHLEGCTPMVLSLFDTEDSSI